MNPKDRIHESWFPVLGELNQDRLQKLNTDILTNCVYYPKKEDIFRVFEMPISDIKVVILGQDPYYSPGLANGLAFAVNDKILKVPPSLKNIQKELIDSKASSLHTVHAGKWQTLEHWKEQGVFLLNTSLTVESMKPASHVRYWQDFIKRVVYYIAKSNHCIWVLWGKKAQDFEQFMPREEIYKVKGYTIENIKDMPNNPYWNYVLTASHPAAEEYQSNAGFYGCNHFNLEIGRAHV